MTYTASCFCGEIKVEISGEITSIIHCHCSKCRKSTGTAYATNGFVDADKFKIISGAEYLAKFGKVAGKYRHFCQQCGSPIYSSNADDQSRIRLRLGILDDDIAERPMAHIFVPSKANWDDMDADLPLYEEQEPER